MGAMPDKPVAVFHGILLAVAALWAAGCAGDFAVQTARDPSVQIASGAGYAFRFVPPEEKKGGELDPRVNNTIVHERIRQAIEKVMAEKGLRLVEASAAMFLVEYRVDISGTLREGVEFRVDSRGDPMRAYSGAYAGGTYGPPPVTAIPTQTTEAELLISVVERSTSKTAYRALGVDANVARSEASEQAIVKTVRALLKGLP
jgi:Domain of unknown function (DUF4136)